VLEEQEIQKGLEGQRWGGVTRTTWERYSLLWKKWHRKVHFVIVCTDVFSHLIYEERKPLPPLVWQ
jgi:hypothetical protein